MLELRQDLGLLGQVLEKLDPGDIESFRSVEIYFDEESGRRGSVYRSERIAATGEETYFSLPLASGEMSFYAKTEPNDSQLRLRSRAPEFLNLFSLEELAQGHKPEQLIATAASLGAF